VETTPKAKPANVANQPETPKESKVKPAPSRKVSAETTKPAGKSEDLRGHLKSLGPEARQLPETIDWVKRNQTKEPASVELHGMSKPELMHSVEFEGIRYHFPADQPLDFNHTGATTISRLVSDNPLPKNLTKHTTDVYMSTQAHVGDAAIAKRIDMPEFRAAATAQHGKIVVYRDNVADPYIMTHEMGHNLAEAKYQSAYPDAYSSDFGKLQKASSKEKPPTKYGTVNAAEDFAESVRLHQTDPETLKRVAPKRYAVIDRLMRDDSYAG
jgi:hypothetical protein